MTIEEILQNEELRQHEFPVTAKCVFLAHAGDCPLPRRVSEALAQYAHAAAEYDQERIVYPEILSETRHLAARLLGCSADEVAFVGPTSLALSLVAAGWPWRRQDNIVVYFDDYPSNVYPWMALAERGVKVRLLNTRSLGGIRPVDVLGQVDEQTRLVALATCHFVSGYRIDQETIGRQLRQRGILLCLDAIQTLGAFPTPASAADFLAADAHKWLLGPCGAGLLYVRRDLQERLRPNWYGWNNVRCPNFIAQEEIQFRSGPARYEPGTYNLLGLVGLKAALELLLEVGVENIARELLRKRAWLVPALQARGYVVLHADAPPERASAIVSFHKPGAEMADLHQKLLDRKIVTSLRTDRSGQRYIRVSPHFYNTDAELHRLLELL
ncbi:MAG: aminotransferase class V-fold PLP-dependent enzyme [Limisphaera sp.]|nr:aminotransferase class V-fold PLP-dependent enzyme [Limisphaera sp.]